MTKNKTNVKEENIPDELKNIRAWVVWRYEQRDGKQVKIPYNPNKPTVKAKANDPHTWGSFALAKTRFSLENFDGIGLELTPPFIGIDYDNVRNPDTRKIDLDVMDELIDLDSYTEISPSGTGLHVIVKGEMPGIRSRRGNREMYSGRRYFTFTGNSIPEKPKKINEPQDVIDALYKKWFGDDDPPHQNSESVESGPIDRYTPFRDLAVIKTCQQSKNCEKFNALWEGDYSNYPSHSEADLALCTILGYRTKDKKRIDRIFRLSGLYRPKWDEKRGKFTYGEMTIKTALGGI